MYIYIRVHPVLVASAQHLTHFIEPYFRDFLSQNGFLSPLAGTRNIGMLNMYSKVSMEEGEENNEMR